MSFPFKLVAFDLDGTLADSKQQITQEMAVLLQNLSKETKVVVISGGSMERFQDQLLRVLTPSSNIILLPAEGSKSFEYNEKVKKWLETGHETFPEDLKNEVFKVLNEIINDPQYEVPPHPQGTYIEDRDTEVAFSGLGQDAPLAEKEKWDPTRSRRFKIKKAVEARIPGVMVAVAGTTSLDILPKGFDKAKGLGLLMTRMGIAKPDVLFMGDAIVPGGNDYSVFEAGIRSIKVSGPKQTANEIQNLLNKSEQKEKEIEIHEIPKFPENPVAYFCSEYALDADATQYAGGLGILAGDYVLQAAEENKPYIFLGLRYGKNIPEGFGRLPLEIEVPIENSLVKAEVWHRQMSPNVHVLLLSSGDLTAHLYDVDFYTRIKQQMVLGIGSVRLLKALKISPRAYHLNEGHTAFAALGLIVEMKEAIGKIVSTKHTILSAAGLLITFADMERIIGPYCAQFGVDVKEICEKGHFELSPDMFSTTKFVLACAAKKNAVSKIHAVFEKKVHPHSTLDYVTNGVYRKRWQAPEFLNRAPALTHEELLSMKRKLKTDLFAYIEKVSGKKFNPDICTMVWARRFAGYKRPYLLFSELERLSEIISSSERPLQCVISGKAHEADVIGQDIVKKIIAFTNTPKVKGRIVYLPDYSVTSAELLTRGADLWLNTPELGKEACGTSGMKASLNGALQFSVRDGWVDEVSWEGVGWSLPGDTDAPQTAQVLYDLLEHEILPTYYGDRDPWALRMLSSIEIIEKNYTAARMLTDYEKKLYTW